MSPKTSFQAEKIRPLVLVSRRSAVNGQTRPWAAEQRRPDSAPFGVELCVASVNRACALTFSLQSPQAHPAQTAKRRSPTEHFIDPLVELQTAAITGIPYGQRTQAASDAQENALLGAI